MPMGDDPTPQSDLETQFGVTSNAEDLIRANRERHGTELRTALNRPANGVLSKRFRPDPGDEAALEERSSSLTALADHTERDVQTANVYGQGANAVIVYTYLTSRGGIEKGTVAYADVFGSGAEQKALAKHREQAAAQREPDAAAREAADKVVQEAQDDADRIRKEAAAERERILAEAREEAEQSAAEANRKAQERLERAQEDAPKAAEKAADQQAKAKQQAARGKG